MNPENCSLEQVYGIIPKSYVRKVARNIDPVSEKTKDLIRKIYSKRKRLWLDGKYDPRKQSRNKRRITDELDEQTSKMCELHRFRVNCFNKLCTSALRENQKEIVNKANEISKTTHESFIVDENLNNILDTNKPITEILDFYREPILNIAAEKKTKDDEDLFYVASLDKIERAVIISLYLWIIFFHVSYKYKLQFFIAVIK